MRFVLLLITGLLSVIVACDDIRQNTIPPEQAAATFANGLGWKVKGTPQCTGTDTDCDGYVTCTVAIEDKLEPESLQCAGLGAGGYTCGTAFDGKRSPFATGCKLTTTKVVVPKQQQ